MENDILKAIELLKAGKTGKVSKNIFTVENAVVFRDVREDRLEMFKAIQEVIAIKTNSGVIIGNSSRMSELEDRRFKKIIQPARIQRILSDHITMIPFTVFKEAGLDLLSCEIIDSGPAETLLENPNRWSHKNETYVERHFTGARLFKARPKLGVTETRNDGSFNITGMELNNARYFLVDVDRREIEHRIINFFLAEIPIEVRTIKGAYLALKPKEVSDFEFETGLEVDRQGEFFFIPCDTDFEPSQAENAEEVRRIQVGNSRPNLVEFGIKLNDMFFVCGVIRHTGREHADLILGEDRYFKVVPNTSKTNFQLTGDID